MVGLVRDSVWSLDRWVSDDVTSPRQCMVLSVMVLVVVGLVHDSVRSPV